MLRHRDRSGTEWIGFGAAPIGNLGREVSEDEAERAVRAAWDLGVRYFDVAPHYGIGLAEKRLGRVLSTYPRDDYMLSTKVGRILVDTGREATEDTEGFAVISSRTRIRDYSAAGAERSIEDSLDRMGLDRFDVVFVHDPEGHVGPAVEGAFVALDSLRRSGTIASYGPAANKAEVLTELIQQTDSDVVLCARTWALGDSHAGEDLLPLATARDIDVVVGGVFYRLLDGQLQRDDPERMAGIERLCERHNVPLVSAALRFPLIHPAVTRVLVGMRSADEVDADLAAAQREVPDAFWADLLSVVGTRSG